MPNKDNIPVIFLAFANEMADQKVEGYLRELPKEVRHLREILKQAERDGLCEYVERTNATAQDIFSVFQSAEYRNRIAVFHYGGHANGYQIMLESADGQGHAADAGGLAAFFGQQSGLELVFLNGCSTQQQARGLLDANVSAVIATSRAIEDAIATRFAGHFYTGLAGGATLQVAFNEAESAIITESGSDTANLYREIGSSVSHNVIADDNPWHLYIREGSESTQSWNLHDATDNPLLGLPDLPERDLPDRPYRQLNWFTRDDAEVFFGRGYQIREMYQLITDPSAAPIILYCGQTGVGKSSLLAAGLIPRLECHPDKPHDVRYFRRRRSSGLAAMFSEELASPAGQAFLEPWKTIETASGNPLTIIIDQLEEVFTRPSAENKDELDDFLEALLPVYATQSARPQGKLILSFRKEWALDVKRRLEELKLPHLVRYLEPLDQRGIIEAIQGPATVKRLQQHYELTVEPGLAELMAQELLRDEDSSLAPTLQIRLGRLWDSAGRPPAFTKDLYAELESESYGLDKFLDEQLGKLQETHATEVGNGLALDILRFHTTTRGTAEAQTRAELEHRYAHVKRGLDSFLTRCEDLYLLVITAAGTDADSQTTQSRLAHDTLAPLIRERFEKSPLAGQRALRVIENKVGDWLNGAEGTPLDKEDLRSAENGARGMRNRTEDEDRLVHASRVLQIQFAKKQRTRKILWTTFASVAALAMLAATLLGIRASNEKTRVHAARVISLAESQKDPLLSSLLILSLAEYGEPAHGVRVALETVQKNIPRDIMLEHDKEVNSLSCNAHDLQVVTASSDQTAKVWDLEFPHAVKTLSGHEDIVFGATFNPFGDRVVSWTDQKVRLWEDSDSETVHFVGCHADSINSVGFRKDGQHLLTATYGGKVRIWDVRNQTPVDPGQIDDCVIESPTGRDYGKLVASLDTQDTEVISASYSPDGRYVVAALADGRAIIWSGKDYREIYTIAVHNNPVEVASFSNDGNYLVTIAYDDKTLLWQLEGLSASNEQADEVVLPEPIEMIGHSDWITSVRFSPDNTHILTISNDKTAMLWDLAEKSNTETPFSPVTFAGHSDALKSGSFSPDGNLVVTSSDDDSVRVWSTSGLAPNSTLTESQLFIGHDNDVTAALFCGNNSRMVSSSYDSQVRLWDARGSSEPLLLTKNESPALDARFSPDGSHVAAAFEDHAAKVWKENPDSGEFEELRELGSDEVRSIDFSPHTGGEVSDNNLLTVQQHPENRKWSLVKEWRASGGEPKTLVETESIVKKAVYSPDGKLFVTTPDARKGHAKVWNKERGGEIPLTGHEEADIRHAEFSRDGSQIITASGSKAIIGDATGSETTIEHDAQGNWLEMAVFSHDAESVATASVAGQVRLFVAGGNDKPRDYPPFKKSVNSIVFGSDSEYLLAASNVGEARLWNKDGAGETVVLKVDDEAMNSARFDPSNDRIVTTSDDGAVRIWRYKWEHLLGYLDAATRVCLSLEERMSYLTEDEETACKRHQICLQREYEKPGSDDACAVAK